MVVCVPSPHGMLELTADVLKRFWGYTVILHK